MDVQRNGRRALSAIVASGIVAVSIVSGLQNYQSMKDSFNKPVDMVAVCQHDDQDFAYLASPGSTGWKCSPFVVSPDVQAWCEYTYGQSATAITLNSEDAFSWRCRT
jgi:hypothetical protein